METEKHYCKYLIPSNVMYCQIYYEIKEALYRIWCGVNRLRDSGVKVV